MARRSRQQLEEEAEEIEEGQEEVEEQEEEVEEVEEEVPMEEAGEDDDDDDDEAAMQEAEYMYDPEHVDERRRIRREYKNLTRDESLQDARAIAVEALTQRVRDADKLFEEVKAPQEATLDAHFLKNASELGAQKARQMKAEIGFDTDDFISKLVSFMGGGRIGGGGGGENGRTTTTRGRGASQDSENDGEFVDELDENRQLDWDLIGRKALAKSRRVPAMDFMLGPLSVEQKKRNTTKRVRQEKVDEVEKRPQEIRAEDLAKNENETSNYVAHIEKFLDSYQKPINLFRLIVNPKSFGQTVENLFYLSFLIRDGKVAMEYDEGTLEPVIYAVEPPTEEDYKNGLRKKQFVMELDVNTWKRAIEVFNITESTLPHRDSAQGQLRKDQWYG